MAAGRYVVAVRLSPANMPVIRKVGQESPARRYEPAVMKRTVVIRMQPRRWNVGSRTMR